MIPWSWSWKFHELQVKNPWSGDLENRFINYPLLIPTFMLEDEYPPFRDSKLINTAHIFLFRWLVQSTKQFQDFVIHKPRIIVKVFRSWKSYEQCSWIIWSHDHAHPYQRPGLDCIGTQAILASVNDQCMLRVIFCSMPHRFVLM